MIDGRSEQIPVRRRLTIYGAVAFLLAVAILLTGVTVAARNHPAMRGGSHPPADTGTPFATVTLIPTATELVEQWIPIQSEAQANIIAAARKSQVFNLNCPPGADCVQDLSRLGTPAYLHVIGAPRIDHLPDLYLIPILDPNGDTLGVAEAALNPSHTARSVVDLVTYAAPLPKGTVAKTMASDAIAALNAQHHTQPAAGK